MLPYSSFSPYTSYISGSAAVLFRSYILNLGIGASQVRHQIMLWTSPENCSFSFIHFYGRVYLGNVLGSPLT